MNMTPYAHGIVDGDAFAGESVRRNFALASNECGFLNFDEGSDFGIVSPACSRRLEPRPRTTLAEIGMKIIVFVFCL
jgi:hypothetical protein